jgi:hypothetical protein
MKLILFFFLLTCSGFAQFPEQHAVLPVPAAENAQSLEDIILAHGGRVAVRHAEVWIVRMDIFAEESIRTQFPDQLIIRNREQLDAHAATPPAAWMRSLFPGGLPGAEFPAQEAVACCSGHSQADHPCAIVNEATDVEAVRAAMQHSRISSRFDPDKTSDVLEGSTVVAVFCVNNINAQQQGVPTWTDQLRSDAIAAIMINLAWWTDQAAAYGKSKSFIIREYGPDHAACAIDFDPTEGYTTGNTLTQDQKFQHPIMDALGYTGMNQTVKMRAFCNDLRAAEGTDWAYLAFLLVGGHTVRAHASFGGPSTVIMASQTAAGFIFAHETGHIFNAFDEYFETAVSNWRARQSRYGIPNGNHHFRNHPVQPSMMARGHRMISGYTAVHLGLADSVRYYTVKTIPPDAAYEVEYITEDNTVTDLRRYQGNLRFAWGNGTRVRLRGLTQVQHDGMLYSSPSWLQSGTEEVTLIVGDSASSVLELQYVPTNEAAEYAITYLTVLDALASDIVQDIVISDRIMAFAGQKGISIHDGTNTSILDYPIAGQGPMLLRESWAATKANDGGLYFTSHAGEILGWRNGRVFALSGPDEATTYRNITATQDGAVWAGSGGMMGGREIPGSGIHRFSDERVTVYTKDNSLLPSDNIVALSAAGQSSIWIGYAGLTDGVRGLHLFDPDHSSLTDKTSLLTGTSVTAIRNKGQDSILVISSGTEPGRVDRFITLITPGSTHEWDASYFRTSGALFDACIDREGRLVVGTTLGVGILEHNGSWSRIRIDNSELPSNICYTVAGMPTGEILVGTNNGAALIAPLSMSTAVEREAATALSAQLHGVYPNPVTQQTATVSYTLAEAGYAEIRIHDILGRSLAVVTTGVRQAGRHHASLPSSLQPGMYLLRLHTKEGVQTTKFHILH